MTCYISCHSARLDPEYVTGGFLAATPPPSTDKGGRDNG